MCFKLVGQLFNLEGNTCPLPSNPEGILAKQSKRTTSLAFEQLLNICNIGLILIGLISFNQGASKYYKINKLFFDCFYVLDDH